MIMILRKLDFEIKISTKKRIWNSISKELDLKFKFQRIGLKFKFKRIGFEIQISKELDFKFKWIQTKNIEYEIV